MYLGNGDGTFRSAGAISLLAGSVAAAAADVNHDGKLDLLVLTAPQGEYGNNSLQVLLGNGAGSFTTGPEIMIDNSEDGCCVFPQLLTGDFNGDGNVDAAFASGWGAPEGYYGTRLRVFTGDGDGNFTMTSNDEESDILNLLAADVNGDGISDLVGTAVDFSDDTDMILPWLDVYYGQSNGGMAPGRIPLEQYGVGQVAVADFNGDGIPDIAVFETDCGSVLDGCTLTSAATLHVISGPDERDRIRPYRFQAGEQSGIAVRPARQSRHQGRPGLHQHAIEQHHLLHPAEHNDGQFSNLRRAEYCRRDRSVQSSGRKHRKLAGQLCRRSGKRCAPTQNRCLGGS